MGAEESIPIPRPPLGFEYFVVGLSKGTYQKIVTILGTDRDRSLVREAICQHWSLGIESESTKFEQAHSFRFNGSPFAKGITATPQFSTSGRRMMAQIFQNLNNSGWELKITSELSRETDLTTLYFYRNPETVPRAIQTPLMCVALKSTDKLLLVNMPDTIKTLVKDIIVSGWKRGIQEEQIVENGHEIQLYGNPWKNFGEETILGRFLLTKIFSALAQQHWHFHATVNMQGKGDSIFFRYDPEEMPQSTQHFMISFHDGDKLRLVNAPQQLNSVVQNAIASTWQKGIQKEKEQFGSWEFKMSGYPWWGRGKDYVVSRYIVCKILEDLQGQGWSIAASIDAYRATRDKTVLMFTPSKQTNPSPVMCMSFCEKDKIRLINAPEDIVSVCRDVLTTRWHKGASGGERMKSTCTAYEVRLNGNAWQGAGANSLHIRSALCYVIIALEAKGWKFLVSADVCSSYDEKDDEDYPEDVHSWWFIKSQDAQ